MSSEKEPGLNESLPSYPDMLFAYVAALFGDPYIYTLYLGCVQEGKQGTVKDTLPEGFFDEAKMEHFLSSPVHLSGLVTQTAEIACCATP